MEGLAVTYVPSAVIQMILTFQCPFELSCEYYVQYHSEHKRP